MESLLDFHDLAASKLSRIAQVYPNLPCKPFGYISKPADGNTYNGMESWPMALPVWGELHAPLAGWDKRFFLRNHLEDVQSGATKPAKMIQNCMDLNWNPANFHDQIWIISIIWLNYNISLYTYIYIYIYIYTIITSRNNALVKHFP